MLNINPFVNFRSSVNNIANLYSKSNAAAAYQAAPSTNAYPNLRPLACDTISFGSSAKLNTTLMNAFDNINACVEVHNNAENANKQLKKVLDDNFDGLTQNSNRPNAPIKNVITRVKTPDSIREKVAAELERLITSNEPTAFNPKNPEAIKATCRDIVGGRIVLAQSDKESTKQVLGALRKAIQNGDLNVKAVKYITSGSKKHKYFTENDVKGLQALASSKRAQIGLPPTTLDMKPTESGYMGLHLIVDLSNPNFKAKDNNYTGEIQIVGYDVSKLKDVEDFCYKLKSKKDIKSGNPAYLPFSKYFEKFFNDSENWPSLQKDFMEYTQEAYRIQREKPATAIEDKTSKSNKGKKKEPYRLPTLAECGMGDRIPQGLDFNNLAKIKYHCDRIADLTRSELSV